MPEYWVIAPYENGELYETVWNFDVTNHCISIGWRAAGDVSGLTLEQIVERLREAYPDRSDRSHTSAARMMSSFYNEIAVGDVIVARRGLRVLSGIGTVTEAAKFIPDRNPDIDHPNFLGVNWDNSTRNKSFDANKFVRPTVVQIDEAFYRQLREEVPAVSGAAVRRFRFELESQLQDFMGQHWRSIFPDYDLYEDEDGTIGLLYDTGDTGIIDILAIDRASRAFIVIELKRKRTSDVAMGQLLRYMGWVKATLCQGEDASRHVRGLIVCAEQDRKLAYAHSMVDNVDIKYYDLSFKLLDTPPVD